MNLFEMLYPRFYFDKSKPIRMFEAFSGVGCQAMALKRITDNYELVGFSEIDVHAIKSYQAIHGEVKNYGDITKMTTIPKCDIFTWSFPCTDLSKAGKQKGLSGGTRSGLVYEVLRLLHATEIKPKVLIMENVIDLVQVKFVKAFNEIQRELEELGYTNYNEVLNAKDFEIPQNRKRVFLVSILKDEENEHYSYDFPIKRPLKIRLKDVLEENVDEKYYLSAKTLKMLTKELDSGYDRAKQFQSNIEKVINDGVSGTLLARHRTTPNDPYWAEEVKEEATVLIKEATTKGYAEATDGDGIYINRPHQKRGVVQKGMTPTLKTSGNDIGVVLLDHISQDETNNDYKVIEIDGKAYYRALNKWYRIRKLTPLECWRQMGISDEDFYKAKNAGVSNSQLYKQAGNGIVVNVFESILKEMIR